MRGNTLDALRRSFLNLTRGRIETVDDSGPVQTISARLMQNELHTKIERLTFYGFHSVPLPPDPKSPKGAEVIVGFMHGNRSHPVAMGDIDRRTKPKNWASGDLGLWHHKGHTAKLVENGWVYDAGSEKKPHVTTVGNATLTVADGKITAQVGGASGPAAVVKSDFVYLGGDPDQGGTFAFVETVSGPSTRVKARID